MEIKEQVKIQDRVRVDPDGELESLPIDPMLFDTLLGHLYEQTLEAAKPTSTTLTDVSFYVGSVLEYGGDEEVFKTVGKEVSTDVLKVLAKYHVIEKYELVAGIRQVIYKERWDSDKVAGVNMPVHIGRCKLVPAKLTAFITKRFQANKSYFEQVATFYYKIIKIIEANFKSCNAYDLILNQYYAQVLSKLNDLIFDNTILPTLPEELWVPFRNLLLSQNQITEIKKDVRKITNRMYDSYAKLQQYIDRYNVGQAQEPDLEQLDEYLGNLENPQKTEDSTPGQEQIRKITVVRTLVDSVLNIVVNDEYDKAFEVGSTQSPWDLLLRLADKEKPSVNGLNLDIRSTLDYVNTNYRCRLYTQSNKRPTKIIKEEAGRIVPVVEIEAIGHKTFQQRLNKLKST